MSQDTEQKRRDAAVEAARNIDIASLTEEQEVRAFEIAINRLDASIGRTAVMTAFGEHGEHIRSTDSRNAVRYRVAADEVKEYFERLGINHEGVDTDINTIMELSVNSVRQLVAERQGQER